MILLFISTDLHTVCVSIVLLLVSFLLLGDNKLQLYALSYSTVSFLRVLVQRNCTVKASNAGSPEFVSVTPE